MGKKKKLFLGTIRQPKETKVSRRQNPDKLTVMKLSKKLSDFDYCLNSGFLRRSLNVKGSASLNGSTTGNNFVFGVFCILAESWTVWKGKKKKHNGDHMLLLFFLFIHLGGLPRGGFESAGNFSFPNNKQLSVVD